MIGKIAAALAVAGLLWAGATYAPSMAQQPIPHKQKTFPGEPKAAGKTPPQMKKSSEFQIQPPTERELIVRLSQKIDALQKDIDSLAAEQKSLAAEQKQRSKLEDDARKFNCRAILTMVLIAAKMNNPPYMPDHCA